MTDLPDHERREHLRAQVEIAVDYDAINRFIADYTANISRGGMLVCSKKPLEPGTRLVFKLGVPGLEEPLSIEGEVIWRSTDRGPIHRSNPDGTSNEFTGMGVRFLFASSEAEQAFHEQVEELISDHLGPSLAGELLRSRRSD